MQWLKTKKKAQTRVLQHAKAKEKVPGSLNVETPIIEFLGSFRDFSDPRSQDPLKLISIKIPGPLVSVFRYKVGRQGAPYQTMIKKLMEEWLRKSLGLSCGNCSYWKFTIALFHSGHSLKIYA